MGDESSDSGDTRPDLSQPVHIEDVPRGRFRLDVSDLELPQALTEMLDERPLPGEGAESGDQFGKYILLERMAEGGMAEVWRAHGPEGRCVVKRVREDLRDRADVMTMFGDEIRLAMRLDHPHVVRALGTGQIDGTEFLALEHLEGSNLALFARQKLGWQTVVAIAIDVARALAYVHPLGVIHRDVCPENVLVTPTGAKLLDFGIARYDDRDHQTRLGELKGRLDRMAPEQRRGEAIDGRADLYALGRTIEAALDPAGERPSSLSRLIARLTAEDRADRPQSAAEVERLLAAVVAEPPVAPTLELLASDLVISSDSAEGALTQVAPPPAAVAAPSRKIAIIAIALAAAVIVAGALVVLEIL